MKHLRDLIKKGKEEGFLKHTEINNLFEDENIYKYSLDNFFDTLKEEKIKIIEEAEEVETEVKEIDEIEKESLKVKEKVIEPKKDIVEIYFQEIKKIPLLTPEKEIHLAKIISNSRKKIKKIEKKYNLSLLKIKGIFKRWMDKQITQAELPVSLKNLTLKEFKDLIKEIAYFENTLSKTKKEFIEANLRLVVSIAKKYVSKRLPLLDLIDEGNVGMIKALDRFDYKQGHKFSTYAMWWIKHTIFRAITDQGRTIRIPVYMIEIINRCVKAIRELLQELGHEPTLEEISKKMGMPVSKIIEVVNISQEPVSLETPTGASDNTMLGDLIEGNESLSPLKIVFLNLLQDEICKLLEQLREKESTILKLRFGLNGYKPHTLEETGNVIGVTRERVRQLEAKALQKLRELKISNELHDFLSEY
ncbi:MAG: sigma-70 family RNA polymerase sigma factor [bacterium]